MPNVQRQSLQDRITAGLWRGLVMTAYSFVIGFLGLVAWGVLVLAAEAPLMRSLSQLAPGLSLLSGPTGAILVLTLSWPAAGILVCAGSPRSS